VIGPLVRMRTGRGKVAGSKPHTDCGSLPVGNVRYINIFHITVLECAEDRKFSFNTQCWWAGRGQNKAWMDPLPANVKRLGITVNCSVNLSKWFPIFGNPPSLVWPAYGDMGASTNALYTPFTGPRRESSLYATFSLKDIDISIAKRRAYRLGSDSTY
jgi:hypothetical protein